MHQPAHPTNPAALEYFRKASQLATAGDLLEAANEFHQSLRFEPHYKTCEYLGECLLRLKRYCEAVVYLASAAYLDPDGGVHTQTRLAESLALAGRSLEAVQAARGALRADPGNAAAKAVLERISTIMLSPDEGF